MIEVLHLVDLSELPAVPPYILGLVTLRDTVMPVVDLQLRFGLTTPSLNLDTHIIVAQTPSGPVAVVADEVKGGEQVAATSYQSKHDSCHVLGVIRLADHLLLLNLSSLHQDVQPALDEQVR